ncbi:MAG: septation protein IspZ [Novosphingobium sp.]|nr:septation protein IspZ [Novosphingobium sp.]
MAEETKPKSTWVNLAVDYGPILVFFAVYRYYSPADEADAVGSVMAVVRSTAAFVIASLVAIAVSKWKLGHISPMLWLSTALIVFFGSLTVIFQESFWIQIKPTVIYLVFGVSLMVGWLRGVSLIKVLLGTAFEGLTERGWMLLSRNWAFFFLVLAGLNEVLRAMFNEANGQFGTWITAKLWVFLPLTFLFTFAQIPMLMRNGMAEDEADDTVGAIPPE